MQNYELGEKIGHGGMGLVYKARDLGLDRDVAIKFMDEALISDPVSVERFLREARLLAKIDHPNVVRVLGAGKDEKGRPYFVMELLNGIALNDRIRKGQIPEAEAVDIACQALSALSEAHSHGITHRDIKPSNILLCPGGRVKVIDFGIARDEVASSVTSTGKIIGTPAYMSPEQAMGEKAGPQSDLYSLGIVIYEMLVGQAPFRAETPVAILMMHTNQPPPALPGYVSPKLRTVIAWALEKRPERRFKTADAMLNELKTASASPSPTPPKGGSSKIDKPKAISQPQMKVGSSSSRGWLVPALLVLFVVGGIGFAWMSGAFGKPGAAGGGQPNQLVNSGTIDNTGSDDSANLGSGISSAEETGNKVKGLLSNGADSKSSNNGSGEPIVHTVYEDLTVPQQTQTQRTSILPKGTQRIQTAGSSGKERVYYEVTEVDGKETSKKELRRETLVAPKDRIVLVGTKTTSAADESAKFRCPRCGSIKRNKYCGNCGYPGTDSRGSTGG